MRIKIDGTLFSEPDMNDLIASLQKKGIMLQSVQKTGGSRKGPAEVQEVVAWIAILANAFLPILVQVIYENLKKRGGDADKTVIQIESRNENKQQKISLPLDEAASSIDIELGESGDLRVFITKDNRDNGLRPCDKP